VIIGFSRMNPAKFTEWNVRSVTKYKYKQNVHVKTVYVHKNKNSDILINE